MQLLYIIPFTLFVIQNLVDGIINQIDLHERDMNELALKKVMYSCKVITQCTFIPVIVKQQLHGWIPGLIFVQAATITYLTKLFIYNSSHVHAHLLFMCSALFNLNVAMSNNLYFIVLYFLMLAIFNGAGLLANMIQMRGDDLLKEDVEIL